MKNKIDPRYSLYEKRPDIAAEWDYKKNEGTPRDYHFHSSKKVFWIDSYGHSWSTTIGNRTKQKSNCPYCGNKKVLKGFNDLASQYPELVDEWDYDLNDEKPDEVLASGHKSYNWICPLGHKWKTKMYLRTINKHGCKLCNRVGTSFPEQAIYYYIKNECTDAINCYLIDGMELDVYIPSLNVAIEYDGYRFHSSISKLKKDQKKDRLCQDKGIRLIRIREEGLCDTDSAICYTRKNPEEDESLNPCIEFIFDTVGINAKKKINVQEEHLVIRASYYRYICENSLEKVYPELADEWCFEKNKGLTPSMLSPGSGESVFWRCKQYPNHIWKDNIYHRTANRGCPYCSNQRILPGFNDLSTKHPELAKEWSPNNKKTASEVFPSSHTSYLWICPKCRNEYPASAANRSKGKGCPFCNNRKPIKGKTDFKTLFPLVAKEWDYSKNGKSLPEDYLPHSDAEMWWICSRGHSFPQRISKRSIGQGCPFCANLRVIPGENDLATLRPDLAAEWNVQRNEKSPSEVKLKSNTYAWWKCSLCGKEWQAYVYNRAKSKNANCIECNRLKRKMQNK